jgi:DNA-binding NtrC family response regulator
VGTGVGKALSSSTISLRGAQRQLGEHHCLIVWINGESHPWPLPSSGEITIGRSPPAEIRIESPAVSRKHARIRTKGRFVSVEDLGSRNSTRVNGELISGERTLSYGDVIWLGDVMAVLDEQRSGANAAEGEIAPEGMLLELGERTLLVADPIMLHVYTQLERLGRSNLSVLIVGETGTGKDLAANAIHAWSGRRDRPYTAINCSALPETLAESELFGYERGAFSGAHRDKAGILESSSGGTVLLDEIGDLPAPIQPKLLRDIENQKVTPLGSVRERPIDVRFVSATHRHLADEVKEGRFRQDLYYRLSPAVIHLPPLRSRHRELPLLARRFLREACLGLGRPPMSISEPAMDRLRAEPWPGNVRELKNVMEYLAATLVSEVVEPNDVTARAGRLGSGGHARHPLDTAAGTPKTSLREAKDEFERRNIEAALAATEGNKTRAAKMLGMPLRTLMWKLKRFGS